MNVARLDLEAPAPDRDSVRGDEAGAVDISIVIVNYNTREVTAKAVESALRHSGRLRTEIIVVDNASSDGSVEALRSAFPEVTVVDTGHNGGYAWGNNVGLHRARGRYVLVLNPDAVLHETTLETAHAYMEDHPEVGILGAAVFLGDGGRQLTVFRFPSLSSLFWHIFVPNRTIRKSRWFGDQRYASRGYDGIMDVDVVAGCFMMLPRAVVDRVGMMEERFFMYSEESEWCWRVRQAGFAVRYNPQVRLTHYGAVSTGQNSPWKSVEIARSMILFLGLTRGPAPARMGTLILLAAELPRAFWILPQRLLGRKRQETEIWRARTGFLLRALIDRPQGQHPPASETAGQ